MRRSLATYLGYFSPTSDELSLDSNKFLQYSSVLTQLAQLKLDAQGVFAGFTGVFTQPIKGAKEGGLIGFFKGAGKGAVGILVRPAAGIIDLASASFKTIQKENEVSQVRPARYIGPDKIVYPYSPNKAIGYALFLQLNNGKLAESDYFFDYVELVEDPLKAILITSNWFALVKHVHTPISDKFKDEFMFGFHELAGPVKTKNTLHTFLWESPGFPRLGLIGKSKKDVVVTRTLTVDTIELADKIKALINQAFDQYKSTMD